MSEDKVPYVCEGRQDNVLEDHILLFIDTAMEYLSSVFYQLWENVLNDSREDMCMEDNLAKLDSLQLTLHHMSTDSRHGVYLLHGEQQIQSFLSGYDHLGLYTDN